VVWLAWNCCKERVADNDRAQRVEAEKSHSNEFVMANNTRWTGSSGQGEPVQDAVMMGSELEGDAVPEQEAATVRGMACRRLVARTVINGGTTVASLMAKQKQRHWRRNGKNIKGGDQKLQASGWSAIGDSRRRQPRPSISSIFLRMLSEEKETKPSFC